MIVATASSSSVGATGTFTFSTTTPAEDETPLAVVVPDPDVTIDLGCFSIEAVGMKCFETDFFSPPCFTFTPDSPPDSIYDFDDTPYPEVDWDVALVDARAIHCQGSKLMVLCFYGFTPVIHDYFWSRNPVNDNIEAFGFSGHFPTNYNLNSALLQDINASNNIDSFQDVLLGRSMALGGAYGTWMEVITYDGRGDIVSDERDITGPEATVDVPTSNQPQLSTVKLSCDPNPSQFSYNLGAVVYGLWLRTYNGSLKLGEISTQTIIKMDGHYHWDYNQDPVPKPSWDLYASAQQAICCHIGGGWYEKSGELIAGIGVEQNQASEVNGTDEEFKFALSFGGTKGQCLFPIWLPQVEDPYGRDLTQCIYGFTGWRSFSRVVFPALRDILYDNNIRKFISDTHIVLVGTGYLQGGSEQYGIWYFKYKAIAGEWGRHEAEMSFLPYEFHDVVDMTLCKDTLICTTSQVNNYEIQTRYLP